ncbi:MAG: cupredoxin domain-containing protein [Limnochordaceae bacterium]|nr:cupredoxin domain-containing protein [Limnochordaceae bacterium]
MATRADGRKSARQEVMAGILVFLAVVGAPLAIFGYEKAVRPALAAPNEFHIIIRIFEDGGFQPSYLEVRRGDRVRIKLTSYDVTHSFQLLDFGIDTGPIFPGTSRVVEFVADRAGTFPFQCNVRCSPLHRNMVGQLVVKP